MNNSTTALFRIDDLFITDGTGVPKQVTVRIRLDIAGFASAAGSGHSENQTGVGGTVRVTLNGVQQSGAWSPTGLLIWNQSASSGLFTGISATAFASTFEVGPFALMTQENITLEVMTNSGASPYTRWGWMQGVCNMQVGLSRGGAAVSVPDGFLANSAQGNIVDNWYMGSPVAVETPLPTAPRGAVELAPNSPNPFVRETGIAFTLARPGPARVSVFAADGRRVADLAHGERASRTMVMLR